MFEKILLELDLELISYITLFVAFTILLLFFFISTLVKTFKILFLKLKMIM